MPTISVAVAIISPGSGVKSTVISMRLPRGRTPTPVERRFAPTSITGTGRMYASSSASFLMLRSRGLLRLRDLVRDVVVRAVRLEADVWPVASPQLVSWSRTKPICSQRLRTMRAVQSGASSMTGRDDLDHAAVEVDRAAGGELQRRFLALQQRPVDERAGVLPVRLGIDLVLVEPDVELGLHADDGHVQARVGRRPRRRRHGRSGGGALPVRRRRTFPWVAFFTSESEEPERPPDRFLSSYSFSSSACDPESRFPGGARPGVLV